VRCQRAIERILSHVANDADDLATVFPATHRPSGLDVFPNRVFAREIAPRHLGADDQRLRSANPILRSEDATAQQRPRLISLDFKDADINNILRILAEFSGLNIVTSDDVKGKVTVRLQNVPWQQALDSVVRAAKLAYVQEGNIIRVDKLENLTKEAEAAFRAEQREVEISQRRKEADLRLAEQERAAAIARQEFEVKRLQLEGLLAPTVEEVIRLRYGHVGVRRVQTIDFFTDVVTTQEERGLEEAITGGIKKEEGKSAGMLSPRGSLTVESRPGRTVFVVRLPIP